MFVDLSTALDFMSKSKWFVGTWLVEAMGSVASLDGAGISGISGVSENRKLRSSLLSSLTILKLKKVSSL